MSNDEASLRLQAMEFATRGSSAPNRPDVVLADAAKILAFLKGDTIPQAELRSQPTVADVELQRVSRGGWAA